MRLTCNGVAALHARVSLSALRGWSADLSLDAASFATGAVTLESGGAVLNATAWRSLPYRGVSQVRLVGGAGGIGKQLQPAAYRQPTVRLVVGDILRAAGETLSASSDQAALGRKLDAWSRIAGSAGSALDTICDAIGTVWSMEDGGAVVIGEPAWAELDLGDAVELGRDELGARATYGLETFAIRPGGTIGGRRVVQVDYTITSGTVRAEVEFVRL